MGLNISKDDINITIPIPIQKEKSSQFDLENLSPVQENYITNLDPIVHQLNAFAVIKDHYDGQDYYSDKGNKNNFKSKHIVAYTQGLIVPNPEFLSVDRKFEYKMSLPKRCQLLQDYSESVHKLFDTDAIVNGMGIDTDKFWKVSFSQKLNMANHECTIFRNTEYFDEFKKSLIENGPLPPELNPNNVMNNSPKTVKGFINPNTHDYDLV